VRFGFLVNEVLTGLRRNVTMTVAMILTTAISIGLFGGGLLVVRLADSSRDIYLDRVESQVFLTEDVSANDPNCDAEQCQALRKMLDDRDDVKSVTFLNKDEAYKDAIKKIPQFKDVASPGAFPASFVVKLADPEKHEDFDNAMRGQPGVLNVTNQKELVDRLFAVLDGISNAAFAVALVQAIGAVLWGAGGALLIVGMRRFGRRWWIPGTVVVVVFGVAITYASPIVLDPLFNKFTVLAQGRNNRGLQLKNRQVAAFHSREVPLNSKTSFKRAKI